MTFDEDLSAWIDGELAGQRRAALEAHLAGCAACSARVAELRAVDRALLALPAPAPGAGLRERLGARLSGHGAPAATAGRRRFTPVLALPLAAAAALFLFLLLRPATPPEPTAEPQLAQRVAPAPGEGGLDALDPEALAVVLELDTIENLPVIANLDLLERLIAAEAG
jgi:anti-sigma factor RsiW